MQTLLWITLAMPAAIFLLAARALVVRGRLESHGLSARATVTSYKQWTDDMTLWVPRMTFAPATAP